MDNHYAIYFGYDGTVLELPHNPETIPVELPGENQEYNVLGIGPITVPRTPKQKKVRIESYFPAESNPETYITFFQDAMYEQRILVYTPVRVDEMGNPYKGGDDGFKCLVENFTTEERGGETGDFYYSLEIVEYRDYSPKIVEIRPVQTGYALTTSRTRTSEGTQVGDIVQVTGNSYSYPTSETSKPVSGFVGRVTRVEKRNNTKWIRVSQTPEITYSSNGHEFVGGGRDTQFVGGGRSFGNDASVVTLKPEIGEYVAYPGVAGGDLGLKLFNNLVGKIKKKTNDGIRSGGGSF